MGPKLCQKLSLQKAQGYYEERRGAFQSERGNGTILPCANFIQYWPPRIKCIQAFNLELATSFFAFDNWVLLKLRGEFSIPAPVCVIMAVHFTPILHLCFSNIHKNWHTHTRRIKAKALWKVFL